MDPKMVARYDARMRERNRRLAVVRERQRWEALHMLVDESSHIAHVQNGLCRAQSEVNGLIGGILNIIESWPQQGPDAPAAKEGKRVTEIEARHRIAARKYDAQRKPVYSWGPIWDGVKFVAHAWAQPHASLDHEQRRETACHIAQVYPMTFAVSGDEPYCEKCLDVALEPLARAFAECEARGVQR
jgi:hypothetical protein